MADLLAIFEKLYAVRAYVGSRRFFLPASLGLVAALYTALDVSKLFSLPPEGAIFFAATIVVVLLLLASAIYQLPHEKYWEQRIEKLLDECDYDKATQVLNTPPWLLGFAARAAQQEMRLRLKIKTGDLLGAYQVLVAAEKHVLLPQERLRILLSKAQLLLNAGNHAAFGKVLAEIDMAKPENGKLRIRHLLLQSMRCELAGLYPAAKNLLEEAIELSTLPAGRICAYNQLARLEDLQGNHTNAQSYYEQAWDLLQASPILALYPVVGHNLLIKYARSHDETKAMALLDAYRCAVTPDNAEQQQQLLNNQVHLARQLGRRELLLDSYDRTQTVLLPLLSEAQGFAVAVSELRMRLNDDVDFSGHFTKTVACFGLHKDLTTQERFHVLSEILVVCQQGCGALRGSDGIEAMRLAGGELLAMEGEIDAQLRGIPPQLPELRDDWHRRKVEILKLKISQSPPAIPRARVKQLFQLNGERRNIWADKQNPERELDALIVFCDEFIAFGTDLGPTFLSEYQGQAKSALADAGKIIEAQWPHPAMHQYALGIAYFYWKIAGRRDMAATWVDRFDSKGLGLAHYASWQREQHAQLKAWLNESRPASADQAAPNQSMSTPQVR